MNQLIINILLGVLVILIHIRQVGKARSKGHAEGWSERHFEQIEEERKKKMRDGRTREFKNKPPLVIPDQPKERYYD